jgi:hypothetical protein
MKSGRLAISRRLSRSALLLAVASIGLLPPSQGSPVSTRGGADGSDAVAGIRPETRLRKLHLVRPDLIPYPIAYEVYC